MARAADPQHLAGGFRPRGVQQAEALSFDLGLQHAEGPAVARRQFHAQKRGLRVREDQARGAGHHRLHDPPVHIQGEQGLLGRVGGHFQHLQPRRHTGLEAAGPQGQAQVPGLAVVDQLRLEVGRELRGQHQLEGITALAAEMEAELRALVGRHLAQGLPLGIHGRLGPHDHVVAQDVVGLPWVVRPQAHRALDEAQQARRIHLHLHQADFTRLQGRGQLVPLQAQAEGKIQHAEVEGPVVGALDAVDHLADLARPHASEVHREGRGQLDARGRHGIRRRGRGRGGHGRLQEEKEGGNEEHVGSWKGPTSVPWRCRMGPDVNCC